MIDVEELKTGNRRVLAKAITLIESNRDDHSQYKKELLNSVMPFTGNSYRVGISGSPGVGKSTFIETFGQKLIESGSKLAVLAVDPTSPISGGCILGDKTRMQELNRLDGAFIRPSPAVNSIGGVTKSTRESILLCEAAGYNWVFVETVGAGQSEYKVDTMTDVFLVLIEPGSGDILQGIKKGIMELADILIVNKADGENLKLAKRTQIQYYNALNILNCHKSWKPKVLTCSSIENSGCENVLNTINEFREIGLKSGSWEKKRKEQTIE